MKRLYDKKYREILEYDLLKVFHFIGARRKKHYMYKLVRIIDGRMSGMHLNYRNEYFNLEAIANESGIIKGAEIVQRSGPVVNGDDI